jgi:glycosyltransferase involved in cell wall biosynthesis
MKNPLMTQKITVAMVTFNEAQYLPSCLSSLSFADEIIVFDLNSSDNSAEISKRMGAKVVQRAKVPIAELYWPELFSMARNCWILRFDPDQIFPRSLVTRLHSVMENDEGNVGAVALPLQNFFLGKRLKTTHWGGTQHIHFFYHRDRIKFTRHVHGGIELKANCVALVLNDPTLEPITHYWVDSLQKMVEKHKRYLALEGKKSFELGERFSWKNLCSGLVHVAIVTLRPNRWFADGWRGLFLAIFYLWYWTRARLSLRYYEKAQAIGLHSAGEV